MVRTLLIRGMLVGFLAGLLAFGFAKVVGEPQVDRAIAFETRIHAGHEEPELVSRQVQAGAGLFTGVVVYCAAFGGLFALVFAGVNGRVGRLGPRVVSALLAGAGFIGIYLVPILKYPANPPAIGEPATIGPRTALFFLMILISVVAMTGAGLLWRRMLVARREPWPAALTAIAAYLVVIALAQHLLPAIDEVSAGFPADTLWSFRIASLGTQAVMWATLGLGFGWLTERAARSRAGRPRLVSYRA